MTADDRSNVPQTRPIIISPWLVVIGALLLYGVTLNHWVSLKSLPLMAQVIGWDWHPFALKWRQQTPQPLFFLLTAPVRLLPAAWEPLALNVFTAVCAALTLGLLARSVRLLPHDRTREQRQRDLGANAQLTMRAAFVPVVFAVLVLGTHLTFWQHAVVATGEMLNVLVFAFIINCLLEFRVSHKDSWMFLSALAYGLGSTNNWALLGFFPVYLTTVFFIMGMFGFFRVKFLAGMFCCGLAGLLLYLMVPALGAHAAGPGGFWFLLHQEFGAQSLGLRMIPRWMWMMAALPTVVPMLFMCFRWPSFEGELSPTGFQLTRMMFGFLHVAFLLLVLAMFFDFKYSPSVRLRDQPLTFLTFYYSGALALGYFSGYVLLVFGPARLQAWERRHPLQTYLHRSLYGLTFAASIGAPALLFWTNDPHIHAGNTGQLERFADETLNVLPTKKSILLSDDAARLYMVQADCERHGIHSDDYILIDTASFPHREYIMYLASRYPALKTVMTTNLASLPLTLGSDTLIRFMYQVSRNFPVYYLHPSFGYYFEALYLKPSGVVYELKPKADRMASPPLPTDAEIKANEAFWAKLENGPLKPLPELAKLNADADAVCGDYGVALDYWGTELQKANRLKEAHAQFAEAVRLNTNNLMASVNLAYNEQLQKGDHKAIDSADVFYRALVYYGGLSSLLRHTGPPDEPQLDLEVGDAFAKGGNLGQAAAYFQRQLQFLPGDGSGLLSMAKTYVDLHQSDKALQIVHELRKSSKVGAWELARCEALAYAAGGEYATAEKVLREGIAADPKDENRVATLGELYRSRALQYQRQNKTNEAALWYTNALVNIDLQLKLLESDGRDTVPVFDVPQTLLEKAQVQLALKNPAGAVGTLTQVLQLQPKNSIAVVNRATTEILLKQYKEARDDFRELEKLLPDQSYLTDFGLAAVAAAEQKTDEEILHLKRCIDVAPEASSEYQRATNRLHTLEHK